LSTINLEMVFLNFPPSAWMPSRARLAAECACRNLRLEILTRLPNQPRPRLDEHCQGGATKRKPAKRLVLFWTTLTGAVEPYNGRNKARRNSPCGRIFHMNNFFSNFHLQAKDQIIGSPLLGGFFQMSAKTVAHGREQLVLKISIAARTETRVERRGQHRRGHAFINGRLYRPPAFA